MKFLRKSSLSLSLANARNRDTRAISGGDRVKIVIPTGGLMEPIDKVHYNKGSLSDCVTFRSPARRIGVRNLQLDLPDKDLGRLQ